MEPEERDDDQNTRGYRVPLGYLALVLDATRCYISTCFTYDIRIVPAEVSGESFHASFPAQFITSLVLLHGSIIPRRTL